jgi:YEATS domain-containing protein 4
VPEFTAVMEKDEVQRLEDAKKKVTAEQEKLRVSLVEKEKELERLKRELNET